MIDFTGQVIHSLLITHAKGDTSSITRDEPQDLITCDVSQNWVCITLQWHDGGSRQIHLNREDVKSIIIGRVPEGHFDEQ